MNIQKPTCPQCKPRGGKLRDLFEKINYDVMNAGAESKVRTNNSSKAFIGNLHETRILKYVTTCTNYNMCQPAPSKMLVNLHQRQQGRTWRGEGRRVERNCSRRIQSHLIQHLSLKLSIFDLRTNCFTNNIQGVFFNWPPPEFAKCWPVSNWFQKNVRVPDWPPLWLKIV